jgi:hypothetical protein
MLGSGNWQIGPMVLGYYVEIGETHQYLGF